MINKQPVDLYQSLPKCKTVSELSALIRRFMSQSPASTQQNWHSVKECLETYVTSVERKAGKPADPAASAAQVIAKSPEFAKVKLFLNQEVAPKVTSTQQPALQLRHA